MDRIATAGSIEFKNGSTIWIPPKGRPFWSHVQPTRELTDAEIRKHTPWLSVEPIEGKE